ncbi:hypothetical protein ABMA28_017383 [Loxostege sticticalis]|uniref:CLIP domain-containing serine protease n=1 Tax=Loxostege sticticalis TaxID=481309 RepID=A0ABD0S2U1_LOXSC
MKTTGLLRSQVIRAKTLKATTGICVNIKDCRSAMDIVKKRIVTTVCGFNKTDPIVCCLKNDTSFPTLNLREKEKTCEPYTLRRPDMEFGKKAFHKCIEYQEEMKYPCLPNNTRRDACSDPPPDPNHRQGIPAGRGQFPHMALLGYTKNPSNLDTAEWLCGGSIISERFILTAGHCTVGPVAIARLGILKRTDPKNVMRDYNIKRYIKHPEYKPPSKYNDIALLETDKDIVFRNKHIVPACLDVGDDSWESEAATASATGWGELDEWVNADVLQIMEISKFSDAECAEQFGPHRLLRAGFDTNTQICYGHRQIPRDTCTGDSGGPLQVDFGSVECMQKVIGVTSFGKACGKTGQPGVYTRVRPYVPWIEAMVWPSA